MHINTCIHILICYIYICIYVCMYVCINSYIHIYIYIYSHTYICLPGGCCSVWRVLQCVAVCCSVLQVAAVFGNVCNILQRTATHCYKTHCNTLQHTFHTSRDLFTWWGLPQHAATRCSSLQHAARHCNTLHYTATCCNTLQLSATHGNILFHAGAQPYGVATIRRLFKIIGLFCKRAL